MRRRDFSETERPQQYDKERDGYPAVWAHPEIARIAKELTQRIEENPDVNRLSQSSAVSYTATPILRKVGVR